MDSCSIRIDLRSMNLRNMSHIWNISTVNDINLILLNQNMIKDFKYKEKLDQICSNLWIKRGSMRNLILVEIVDNDSKHEHTQLYQTDGLPITAPLKSIIRTNKSVIIKQLTKKWNIPHIDLKFDDSTCDEQDINEMLIYSIKYYWFSHVKQN